MPKDKLKVKMPKEYENILLNPPPVGYNEYSKMETELTRLKELNREMVEALKECSYRLSCSARINDLQASQTLIKVDNVIAKAGEGE